MHIDLQGDLKFKKVFFIISKNSYLEKYFTKKML